MEKDIQHNRCQASPSLACSAPLPGRRIVWKWWIWNKVEREWKRCNGMSDFDSEAEAIEHPPIYRLHEETPVLLREVTEYSSQNS